MFHELKYDLEHHGVSMEQYLKDLKKTEEEIYNDFAVEATKRAKAAIATRQIAVENDIKVDEAELEAEIVNIRKAYQGDKQIEEKLADHHVIDTIANTIQNKKVIKFLKEKVVVA
jgi:FKBP-type peptidyl-prolyl cis-trans isomerase (trigger factor)